MSRASEFLEKAKSIREGFVAEVMVSGETKWRSYCILELHRIGPAMVFGTQEEAEAYVSDLMMRWLAVTDTRVVPVDKEPTYTFIDGKLQKIGEGRSLREQEYALSYFDTVQEEIRAAIEAFHEEQIAPCVEKVKAAIQDLTELLQELGKAGQELATERKMREGRFQSPQEVADYIVQGRDQYKSCFHSDIYRLVKDRKTPNERSSWHQQVVKILRDKGFQIDND
jgi:hypothetical protein